MGFTTLFAILAGLEIGTRVQNSWVIRESRLDIGYTHEIAGSQTATWIFRTNTGSIDKLWLFFHPIAPENEVKRILHASLVSTETSHEIRHIQRDLSQEEYRNGRVQLNFDSISISNQERLRLDISLPTTASSEGFYLHYQLDRKSNNEVSFGTKKLPNADLSMMLFGERLPFPSSLAATGVALLALIILSRDTSSDRKRSVLPEAITSSAVILLTAAFFQDLRVDLFHGNYWPDEYPAMAFDCLEFLSGHRDWTRFQSDFSEWRNGQVFLAPLLLAIIQLFGVHASTAYQILISVSVFGTVFILVHLCASAQKTSRFSYLSLLLAFMTNPFLILAAGEFQTDITGTFFAVAAVTLLIRFAESQTMSNKTFILMVACIALATFTRLSNLPLLLLPACLGIWLKIVPDPSLSELKSPWKKLIGASAASIGLVCLTWWVLGLFGSFDKALAFSQRLEFRNGFSWGQYSKVSVIACWPILLATIFGWKIVFRQPRFLAIGGSICALLLILAIGRVIPWYRYWIPINILSLLFAFQYIQSLGCRRFGVPALFLSIVAINLGVMTIAKIHF